MKLRMILVASVVAVVMAPGLAEVTGRAAGAPAPPPDSAEAQQIIYKVEEIFWTHPGRAAICKTLLNDVLERYPGTKQAALALAYLSYGYHAIDNDIPKADALQEQLDKEFPNERARAELYILRGEAYEAAGQFERAGESFARAVTELQVKHQQHGKLMLLSAVRLLAGVLANKLGDPAAAVAALRKADAVLEGTPPQSGVWMHVAEIAARHGGASGVPRLEDLRQGRLAGLSADARAAAILGTISELRSRREYGQVAETLALLENKYAATAHAPGIALARAHLADVTEPGDEQTLLYLWGRVVERFPTDPRATWAYGRRAQLFVSIGAVDSAIAELEAGAANPYLYPGGRGGLLVQLGNLYRDLGRREDAIAAYQRARLPGAGAGNPYGRQAVRRLEELGVNPWPEH